MALWLRIILEIAIWVMVALIAVTTCQVSGISAKSLSGVVGTIATGLFNICTGQRTRINKESWTRGGNQFNKTVNRLGGKYEVAC
jgi:hypothetical protein